MRFSHKFEIRDPAMKRQEFDEMLENEMLHMMQCIFFPLMTNQVELSGIIVSPNTIESLKAGIVGLAWKHVGTPR